MDKFLYQPLTFTEGDTAEIYVHNNLDEETSLHWHGLFYQTSMMVFPIYTDAHKAAYHASVQISHHTARYTLVPQSYRAAGTNRHVWRFYHEQKKRMGYTYHTCCAK